MEQQKKEDKTLEEMIQDLLKVVSEVCTYVYTVCQQT